MKTDEPLTNQPAILPVPDPLEQKTEDEIARYYWPKDSMPDDEPAAWFKAAIADAFDCGRTIPRTGSSISEDAWQPIETAPKGSWLTGPQDTRHPDYVAPPRLWLLLGDGEPCVGYADAYYAEGGSGYDEGTFWVEKFSGERITPTHWQPLPAAPPVDPCRPQKSE